MRIGQLACTILSGFVCLVGCGDSKFSGAKKWGSDTIQSAGETFGGDRSENSEGGVNETGDLDIDSDEAEAGSIIGSGGSCSLAEYSFTETTEVINDESRIRTIVNEARNGILLAQDHIFADEANADAVCRMFGYEVSTAFTGANLDKPSCATYRVAFSKNNGAGFRYRDGCFSSPKKLTGVTCKNLKAKECNRTCPETFSFNNTLHIENTVASFDPTVPYSRTGPSQGLTGETLGGVHTYAQVSGSSPTSIAKVCDLIGYQNVLSSSTKSFRSPSDNYHVVWDGSVWNIVGARSDGNRQLETLVCGQPKPSCRSF